jgi:hypothetical protein
MTAKQLLYNVMLSYFRHLIIDTGYTPGESADMMVSKLIIPGPDPTAVELRWLNAVKARIKAELTIDKSNDEEETPLFDVIPQESTVPLEKATKKAK